MARIKTRGSLSETKNFLKSAATGFKNISFDEFGKMGVNALREVTPVRTGKTAASWEYRIVRKNKSIIIEWHNTNLTNNGEVVALLLQYGHGTPSGYFVEGKDHINPAMKPIFEQAINKIWMEVNK